MNIKFLLNSIMIRIKMNHIMIRIDRFACKQFFYYKLLHSYLIIQIHIDIPRMKSALLKQRNVQEMFERILFIWAIRHPASGYVQGMNDLVTPFYVVFLQEYLPIGIKILILFFIYTLFTIRKCWLDSDNFRMFLYFIQCEIMQNDDQVIVKVLIFPSLCNNHSKDIRSIKW